MVNLTDKKQNLVYWWKHRFTFTLYLSFVRKKGLVIIALIYKRTALFNILYFCQLFILTASLAKKDLIVLWRVRSCNTITITITYSCNGFISCDTFPIGLFIPFETIGGMLQFFHPPWFKGYLNVKIVFVNNTYQCEIQRCLSGW